ncbi:MAG: Spo0E family sporulation regulatory protein-aspartic acid phosphatase [Anaerocolumna sp.]
MIKVKNIKKYGCGICGGNFVLPSSNLRYFYIEKKRQELHKLITYYGGISNSCEIFELSRKFDDVLIEHYHK